MMPKAANAATLIEYDFENFALGQITGGPSSTAPGITSAYNMANHGAANFPDFYNNLSITRFFGSVDFPSLSFSLTSPTSIDRIEFFHIHNHTQSYPTYPDYDVQVQLDAGSGYNTIATFKAVQSGSGTEVLSGPGLLAPGAYSLRWIPLLTPDTNTDFFGLDNIRLRNNSVPGPLPLLGLGAAYSCTRQLRRRVRAR